MVDGNSDDEGEASQDHFASSYGGGGGDSGGSIASALQRRDRSLKLEAQFLRCLACIAGVLGGICAREQNAPSLAADGSAETKDSKTGESPYVDAERVRATPSGMVNGVSAGVGATVPGHVMRRLETLALRLVEKFPLLSYKDRGLVCRGLCQLWLALSGPGQGDNLSRLVSINLWVAGAMVGTSARRFIPLQAFEYLVAMQKSSEQVAAIHVVSLVWNV